MKAEVEAVPVMAYRLVVLVKPCAPEERLELERALFDSGGHVARHTPELGHVHLAVDYPFSLLLRRDLLGQGHPAQGVLGRFGHLVAAWTPGSRG